MNELDKVRFQYDMAFDDFKDLPRRVVIYAATWAIFWAEAQKDFKNPSWKKILIFQEMELFLPQKKLNKNFLNLLDPKNLIKLSYTLDKTAIQ